METLIIEQLLDEVKQLTFEKSQAVSQLLVSNELLKQKDKQIAELEELLETATDPDKKEGV